jgi:hypothetical protein
MPLPYASDGVVYAARVSVRALGADAACEAEGDDAGSEGAEQAERARRKRDATGMVF